MKFRLISTTSLMAALVMTGCATTSPSYNPGYGSTSPGYPASSYPATDANCYDCGTVTRIETTARGNTVPNATGGILGGIVGAVAGHEISDRTGGSKGNQNIATVAGAVGGAIAGNAIQNRAQNSATYHVTVRMNDGRLVTVTQNDLGAVREGSFVRVYNGQAMLR